MREVGGDWQTLTNATYPQGLWSCGRWERASLDLSPHAGKEVQIGFLFHSQINSNGRSYVAEGWYLDDLEIVSGPMEFRNPEGFEAPDFWDRWYSDNGVWEVGVPAYGPTNAVGGVKVAATILDGDYCDAYYGRDSRLISPRLSLPDVGAPTLQFQSWYSFSHDDYGAVEVRTSGGEWEELTRLPSSSDGRWYAASQGLGKYTGKEIQIAFRFHSQVHADGRSYVAPGWYLDQVELRTGLLRVEPEAILFDGLVIDELTPGSFRVHGGPPGWRYGLADGSPAGASLDPDLGLFHWVPDECQGPALTFITLALFNAQGQPMDLLDVPVIVGEVNEPPRIGAIAPLAILAGVAVPLNVAEYAYDPDCPAQVLTYSLDAGSPFNAALNPETGILEWTPTVEQAAQTNTIHVRVTDDAGVSATQTVLAGPFEADPVAPRISSVRLDGTTLEVSLSDATPGQTMSLESAIELKAPPTATVWTEVRSFAWQANPVRFENVFRADEPRGFFRLRLAR